MKDDIVDSEAFWEGVKKVGPGSEFRYRCIFDPTPVVRRPQRTSTEGKDT